MGWNLTTFGLVAAALALIAVVLMAGCAVAFRRTQYSAVQIPLFVIAWLLNRFLWRTTFPRGFTPPAEGAVLVCNHRSSVDPFFIQMLFPRPVHWMVAKEYCESWAFGWFLRTCQVIPVNRGGVDTAATKAAIEHVAAGGIVGMFPEGRINMSDQLMLPGRPGAVLVALKAHAPLLPCYVSGAPYHKTAWSPFFMFARVRVAVGSLIDLSAHYGQDRDHALVRRLTRDCLREIARLAGEPDFEPQIAGRKWKPGASEEPPSTPG